MWTGFGWRVSSGAGSPVALGGGLWRVRGQTERLACRGGSIYIGVISIGLMTWQSSKTSSVSLRKYCAADGLRPTTVVNTAGAADGGGPAVRWTEWWNRSLSACDTWKRRMWHADGGVHGWTSLVASPHGVMTWNMYSSAASSPMHSMKSTPPDCE